MTVIKYIRTSLKWKGPFIDMNINLLIPVIFLIISCTEKKITTDVTLPGSMELTSKPALSINHNVVAFIYHRIGDNRYPTTNTNIQEFDAHLNYLKEKNYSVITLSEAISISRSKEDRLGNSVLITIDDAFLSFYQNGFPLLKKYGLKATLFVNTESVGGGSYMSWQQIAEVNKYGIEIGNHSHSHAYFLNKKSPERYRVFKDDVQKAQDEFEKNLSIVPNIFAYPYGEYDLKMKEIIREMGFKAAMAQYSGVIHGGTDILSLPRFPMSSAYASYASFVEKLNMRPLYVTGISADEHEINADNDQPTLELSFDSEDLVLSQLQCFIQGNECLITLSAQDSATSKVLIRPKKPLSNRRTLYTITAPDSEGKWHWFSYLWVNPAVP